MSTTGLALRPHLTVVLAGEACAIDVVHVVEVIERTAITRVPGTPDWALGVLNLRGAVVPVVDLARKLGLPGSGPGGRGCIVMVERIAQDERRVVGILADAVDTVVDVALDTIEPPPAFGSRIPAEHLAGLARCGERLVPLLDVGRALADPSRPSIHD